MAQWVPQICKFHSRQKNKQPVTLSQDANAARAPCCLHESKVANECFISSELSAGIEVSVRPILLILPHESGLSPLKTLGTASSVKDYKYAWKSILIWQRGEDVWGGTHGESRGHLGSAHSLHSFILLLSSFCFTCAYMYSVWPRKYVQISIYILSLLFSCPCGPL